VTTTAPTQQSLSGSATSSTGVTMTLTTGDIAPFSPVTNAGGDVAPAEAGELFIGITAHVSFDSDANANDGVLGIALVRPDGISSPPTSVKSALLDRGQEHDEYYVFAIPATTAGDYVVRFATARDSTTVDLPFTLT